MILLNVCQLPIENDKVFSLLYEWLFRIPNQHWISCPFIAVQQTRAQDFEKGRRRTRRHQTKSDIRRETDFVSLSDFVCHLQAVEPYQRPRTSKNEARSTSEESDAYVVDSANAAPKLAVSENTTEIAARLLFMSIHWAKDVRHFSELSHFDQVVLLQENWYKLFVINLVQWAMPFEIAPLVADVVEKTPSQHLDGFLHNLGKLNEVVCKFLHLELDRAEFCLIKALALFNPGKLSFPQTLQEDEAGFLNTTVGLLANEC